MNQFPQQNPTPYYPPYPFVIQQGGNQNISSRIPEVTVPPRIDKAMDFLQLMAIKCMPRIAINDLSIEHFEGVKPTVAEEEAHDTACNLLTSYFKGKLPNDQWEGIKHDALQKHVKTADAPATLMHCVACGVGPINPNCKLCGGKGRIIIQQVVSSDLPNVNNPNHPRADQADQPPPGDYLPNE